METKTRSADASEFCLVLTPTWGAASRASEAIRERFASISEEIRGDLAAVVAELVQNSVDHRPDRPIVVTVAVGNDAIHGEVADRGNPAVTQAIASGLVVNGGRALLDELTSRWDVHEGTTDVWFELPLER